MFEFDSYYCKMLFHAYHVCEDVVVGIVCNAAVRNLDPS